MADSAYMPEADDELSFLERKAYNKFERMDSEQIAKVYANGDELVRLLILGYRDKLEKEAGKNIRQGVNLAGLSKILFLSKIVHSFK